MGRRTNRIPLASLSPEDTDTAFTGGIQVARMCVGLVPADFMHELGEATNKMRASLVDAGISPAIAHLTIEALEVGARSEWRRVYRPEQLVAWGKA